MNKIKWFILSEIGWVQFSCGFCIEELTASEQLSLFSERYPGYAFTFKDSK